MKFACLNGAGDFNFPPCHLLNFCGFHILFDCPMDLSALTIFSPIPNGPYEKLHDYMPVSSPSSSSNLLSVNEKTQTMEKPLDASNLIHGEPCYKTVERLHLWDVSLIDVVLISSPMGMLGLPFLTRAKGFSAKIYATEATARLGQLMMEDLVAMNMEYRQYYGPDEAGFLQQSKWEELEALQPAIKEVALGKEGTELGCWIPLYSAADIKDCLLKVHALRYAEEACYNGILILKGFSSGLELGSCNWTLKDPKRSIAYLSSSVLVSGIAKGFDLHAMKGIDILIYSDFSSRNEVDCVGSETRASCSAISNSSPMSDGELSFDSLLNNDQVSEEMEKLEFVCSCSIDSVKAGGSVLIPIGRLGIVLQLLEQFLLYLESSDLKVPIFMISTVAEELLAYTNILPEWLCEYQQQKLYAGEPVFAHVKLIKDKKLHIFPAVHSHELLMMWQEPCIVFCPHWSLRLGPAVHLLRRFCGNQNSLLVMEGGVDADLALLPFRPIEMKVLQCSFLSGIKLQNVPQLLKILQAKFILLPEFLRQHIGTLSDSLPYAFYSENELLEIPKLKEFSELYIATELSSQLRQTKLRVADMNISRLNGALFVEQGKYLLRLENKHPVSADTRQVLHWGMLDLKKLKTALRKVGIDGNIVVRGMSEHESENVSTLHIHEPSKASIEVKAASTVVTTDDENLASLIAEAITSILCGI